MKSKIYLILILGLMAISGFSQVVVSDEPGAVPSGPDVLFEVKAENQQLLSVIRDSSVRVSGLFEADSAIIHGPLTITSNGGSFNMQPNVTFPAPIHDLTRLSTRRYSIMGGTILGIPFPPWSVWISTSLLAMGVNTQTPNNMLDVNGGDIDVNTPTFGYMIGDNYVLRHKGNTSNLYAGVNAGFANSTGSDLTVVGFDAASQGTNLGVQNTFIGSGAGRNVGTGGGLTNDYTFVGYQAGFSNTFGVANTFIGSQAGFNEMGDENVYVGWMAGYNNGSASHHNTFVGNISGLNNQSGSNNTFIGIGSGINNINGSNHVGIGASAGPASANLFNTVAIGLGTSVPNNNQMILGDNSMMVGIGLNADVLGPQNKLEIDAGLNGMNPVVAGNIGASGLRFRDLHAATLTVANPGPGVLSVDASGDVIYVDPLSSVSMVTVCSSTPPPVDNVVKIIAPNTLCETNITDLYPVNNVGINNTAPNDALDVGLGNSTGHIDVNTPTSAYKLADREILWHKGASENIFLGVDAALNHLFNKNSFNTIIGSRAMFSGNGEVPPNFQTNMMNTMIGYEAGFNFNANNAVYVGYQAGYNHNAIFGTANTFVGFQSGFTNQAGAEDNTFYGAKSGFANTFGDQNCFIGLVSGEFNTTGSYNSFLGLGSGRSNGVFNFNTYVGANAGATSLGHENTFMGYSSGILGIGNYNVVLGSQAMQAANNGDENTVVGYKANYNSPGTSNNTIIGSQAAFNNQSGASNTYIGYHTAYNQTSGSGNAYFGYNTGLNMLSGSDNTFLGGRADATVAGSNLNNAAAIGANALVTNSNQMILGDNNVFVGIGLSSDVSGPQNKLEIDAGVNGLNATLAGNTGASGLRLRDLHDQTLPVANPNNVFLSVDGNGDVVLVGPASGSGIGDNGLSLSGPTPGNIHLGQSTGAAGDPAQLLDNREIPMYGFRVYFMGDAVTANSNERVDIGDNTIYPVNNVNGTKLNVQTRNQHSSATFVNEAPNNINSQETYAVKGLKLNGTSLVNAGVYGYGEMDPTFSALAGTQPVAIGVKGVAQNRALMLSGTPGDAYGVWGEAMDNLTENNFGGYFIAQNAQGYNYAVYGDAAGFSNGTIGNPNGPTYAGFFNGDVYISGLYGPSDQKLKKDISDLNNALGIVMGLKPRTYHYRQEDFPGMSLPSGKQYGLIAQEVETVLPEIVMENVQPARFDESGRQLATPVEFKSMDYQEIIPVLVKAIQEQQAQIEYQQAQITALQKELGK